MKRGSLAPKFFLLKALHYAITTSFSSFVLAYLKDARSLDDSRSSLLLMLYTIGAFAGQFAFGRLCDVLRTHKKAFWLSCGLIAPVAVALYTAPAYGAIAALYMLFGFCQMPLSVVIDTWFLDSFPGDTGLYGKVLASGACAYAVLSFSYGRLLDAVGYGIMPYCLIGLLLLAVLLSLAIPDASSAASAEKAAGKGARLISAPLALLLVALLGTGFCGNTYSLLPVLMDHVPGGSLGLLGLAMSSSGIFQIPFMLITGKMKRVPARLRVAIAGVIYFVMVMCFAFGNSPWYLIFGAGISGAAWGILLPAYRELVEGIAPAAVRTTAQGLADATYLSLGGVCASGFVSATSGSLGLRAPLLMISAVQAAAIALLLLWQVRVGRRARG